MQITQIFYTEQLPDFLCAVFPKRQFLKGKRPKAREIQEIPIEEKPIEQKLSKVKKALEHK